MSWPLVKLEDICDLQNGYAFKSSDYVERSNTLSCRMSNIRPGGKFDIEYNARYLPDDFADKYQQFLLKEDDVIIAMTDLADSPKILGVPTVVKTNGKSILLNQRVGKLVIKDHSQIYFPYLQHVLNAPKTRSVYKRFAGGGLQINLGKKDLLSVEIPLPPLAEQKRIAAILDKADAIRQKRKQAIDLADDFLRSVFLDMFGDPVTNPKGWEVHALGKLCEDLFLGLTSKVDYVDDDSGYPLVRAKDINTGELKFDDVKFISESQHKKLTKNHLTKKGDLLVSKSGTLGTCAIVRTDREFSTYESIFTVRPIDGLLNVNYLIHLLQNNSFKAKLIGNKVGGTVAHLNLKMFRDFELGVPTFSQQEAFSKKIEKVEMKLSRYRESLKKSEYLFNSLSQKAFSGEL